MAETWAVKRRLEYWQATDSAIRARRSIVVPLREQRAVAGAVAFFDHDSRGWSVLLSY
jgi:hypothetical protein